MTAVEVRCVSPHAERPEWVPAAWGWAPDEEPWLIMPGRSDGTLHPCAWHTLKCFASMDVAGRQVCIVYGAPLQIAPQPVPVMISCTPVAVGLEQAVVMQVQTVTGTQMYFLPADLAKQVSRHLNAAAQGIVLAS